MKDKDLKIKILAVIVNYGDEQIEYLNRMIFEFKNFIYKNLLKWDSKILLKIEIMAIQKYFLPDFIEIQRKSFGELLDKGIIEEFSKRNPINNEEKDLELYFYPEAYKLSVPEFTPREAILNSKSYTSKLFIPVQLTDKISKIIA